MSLLLALTLLAPSHLHACAQAVNSGELMDVVKEEAIIVWDPQTETEHFIRKAAFAGAQKDFGFLVPTPTRPTLSETDDAVFAQAAEAARPTRIPIPYSAWWAVIGRGFDYFMAMVSGGAASMGSDDGGVELVETKTVADLEAAILKADDHSALVDWLKEHQYQSRPALAEWLRYYTEHGWYITAFKISPIANTLAETKAVRLSFKTPQPFFPYREPADQRDVNRGGRLLNLYVIAPGKARASLGTRRWHGTVEYSAPLRRRIDGIDVPEQAWLTAFSDRSEPRPGIDEVFINTERWSLPVNVVMYDPVAVLMPLELIPLAALAVVLYRRRKRKAG
ncbi:MAG: DUF2330 domain-containing protein [Elusimicrobia bacterium]|nr:DUF2330 domain-containing protein [Elusimicrobiota bacterium]